VKGLGYNGIRGEGVIFDFSVFVSKKGPMASKDPSEESTPLRRHDANEDMRYGESERAIEYRRLMKILKAEYPTMDWMMCDTLVNLHLDEPHLTPDDIANDTPRDYKFYTPYKETGEKRPREKESSPCPNVTGDACDDGPSTSSRPMEVM
jgi:hypothetical protein